MTTALTTFSAWLLKSTWQASLLVLIILVFQWVFRKRLTARWRHALWFLLLIRLLLPAPPESSFSLFNYARVENRATAPDSSRARFPETPDPMIAPPPLSETETPTTIEIPTYKNPGQGGSSVPKHAPVAGGGPVSPPFKNLAGIGALVWLLGVVLLMLRIVGQNLGFALRLQKATAITEPEALVVFHQCKELMGLRFSIGLKHTKAVTSPALYGFFRPTLLLPSHLLSTFSRQELRFIFLHELAHIKRHDMAIHWVATVLNLLHWFNPVVWLAFRRMAADRELACDELVLTRAEESSGPAYGETILKLLEGCARPPGLPGLMGILEDKDQIFLRITMIAKFRKPSRRSMLALVLLAILGVTTLTDAQTNKPPQPTESTARLEKGVTIGGVIMNHDGQGIPKVKLVFTGLSPTGISDRERTTIMGNFHEEYTDDKGQWRCNHVPARFESLVYRAIHPEYLPAVFGTENSTDANIVKIPAKALAANNAVMVLQGGVLIAGRVVDPEGQPVTSVYITQNRDLVSLTSTVTNNSDGRFLIRAARPGELKLTIQTKNYAPQTITLLASNGMPELTVSLKPGKALRGLVVDAMGQPIPDATVILTSANSIQPIYSWRSNTDAQGRFEWTSAPEEPLPYKILKSGYFRKEQLTLLADGSEHVITLQKAPETDQVLFTGRVADATSKQPIEKFTVRMKEHYRDSGGYSPFRREFTDVKGEFSLPIGGGSSFCEVEIRAAGHMPQVTNWSGAEHTGRVWHVDFALEKNAGFFGKVLRANGEPVIGAEVALATDKAGVFMGRQRFMYRNRVDEMGEITDTAADGSFSFQPAKDAHTIFAVHDDGFAEVKLTDAVPPITVKLMPWGRIEGTMRIGTNFAVGETAGLTTLFPNPTKKTLQLGPGMHRVTTDGKGRFTFENVPPGEYRVCRMIPLNSRGYRYGYGISVVVKAGETTRLDHGGQGRAIKTQITSTDANRPIDWASLESTIFLQLKIPRPSPPNILTNVTQRSAWWRTYYESDAAREYFRRQRSYALLAEADGTIQAPDILPGDYELQIRLSEPTNGPAEMGKTLCSVTKDVQVPDADAGSTDPFDLGVIAVNLSKPIQGR